MKAGMEVSISIAGIRQEDASKISNKYRIDEKGKLRLPFIEESEITALGLSSSALARKIEQAYKKQKIFRSPVLTVATYKNESKVSDELREKQYLIDQANKRKEEERRAKEVVYVTGAVIKPGKIPFIKGMTLRILLSECGGHNTFGSDNKVILHRGGKKETIKYEKYPSKKEMKLKIGDQIEIPNAGFFG